MNNVYFDQYLIVLAQLAVYNVLIILNIKDFIYHFGISILC